MNERDFDTWLDEQARALPNAIEPPRDLWPNIAERLEETELDATAGNHGSRLWPFAAGVAATVLVTFLALQLTQRSVTPTAEIVPTAEVTPTVNGTAPNPARQGEFARVLGRVLHRPAGSCRAVSGYCFARCVLRPCRDRTIPTFSRSP